MNNWSNKQIRKAISEIDGVSLPEQNILSEDSEKFYVDRYQQIIKLLPSIKKTSSVLDVGLSNGFLSLNIQRRYDLRKLHTLEHPLLYRQYTKRFLKIMSENNITVEPVDLRDKIFPWVDNFFDYIIFSETLEHLMPADVPHMFREFDRILNERGQLIITTPNIASMLKRLKLFLLGVNPNQLDLRIEFGSIYGHIREYTSDEIVKLIPSNYKVTKHSSFSLDRNKNIYTKLEYNISHLFPQLSNGIFIVFTKQA